jgi:hypothetical protein
MFEVNGYGNINHKPNLSDTVDLSKRQFYQNDYGNAEIVLHKDIIIVIGHTMSFIDDPVIMYAVGSQLWLSVHVIPSPSDRLIYRTYLKSLREDHDDTQVIVKFTKRLCHEFKRNRIVFALSETEFIECMVGES